MLIEKFLTSQTIKQVIKIHILPNISKSEGNQAMKFGQWIQYNLKNSFLQKSCRIWYKETSSRSLF